MLIKIFNSVTNSLQAGANSLQSGANSLLRAHQNPCSETGISNYSNSLGAFCRKFFLPAGNLPGHGGRADRSLINRD
jgi:hypothetical protein